MPVLDFAGGTVVAYQFGSFGPGLRLFSRTPGWLSAGTDAPHSVVLSLIGTGLLWVGWFGFNAGSALGSNELATRAFAATHFSAAAAALSWGATEWYLKGKPSVLVWLGDGAGLATITPASGFVSVPAAVLIGFSCRFSLLLSRHETKDKA